MNIIAVYRCQKCKFEHRMSFPFGEKGKPWKSTTCENPNSTCSERRTKQVIDNDSDRLQKELDSALENPRSTFKRIQELKVKIKKKQSGRRIARLFKKLEEMKKDPKVLFKDVHKVELEIQNAHGFPVKTAKLIDTWEE